jgi:ABC-2 type transport system ATP-binding protein
MPGKQARARADELLERFALSDAGGRPVKTYSGGMRRRLDLAAALVAEPPVLFLDEPTTGLDLPSRLELWAIIRELVGRGSTLLLTTQYLEEADQLADEILVIDHGKAIASGTAEDLKNEVGGERLEFTVADEARFADAVAALAPLADGEIQPDAATRSLMVPISGGAPVLTKALRVLERRKIALTDAGIRRPTLDDVFLSLTGHAAEPQEDAVQAEEATKKGRR